MRRRSISTRNKRLAALAPILMLGLAASCRDVPGPPPAAESTGADGLLDLADALRSDEAAAVRAAIRAQAAEGRDIKVVIARPSAGDSLERIGWATARGTGSTLILIDPESEQVRIEGALPPEAKASIAAAMAAKQRSEALSEGIVAGLGAAGRLAP